MTAQLCKGKLKLGIFELFQTEQQNLMSPMCLKTVPKKDGPAAVGDSTDGPTDAIGEEDRYEAEDPTVEAPPPPPGSGRVRG